MLGISPQTLLAMRRRGELDTVGMTAVEHQRARAAAGWSEREHGWAPGIFFRLSQLRALCPDAEPPPKPAAADLLTKREHELAERYRRTWPWLDRVSS